VFETSILLAAVVGGVLGLIVAWLTLRTQSAVLHERAMTLDRALKEASGKLNTERTANADLLKQVATLTSTLGEERKTNQEKQDLLNHATAELTTAFQALAAKALHSNNESFLQLAKTSLEKFQTRAEDDLEARSKAVADLVTPIHDALTKVDSKIQQIEGDRKHAYGTLTQQVLSLVATQEQLRDETGNLVRALRSPAVRGRWGEIQLKRVVEMAGMLEHCDFLTQAVAGGEEGRIRPDLIVRLPGGKTVVVDAKTPLEAYLRAVESDETGRKACLADHARQVRAHLSALGRKSYWEQFDSAPEFAVLFLPGECFFSAALEADPGLIEFGVQQNIVLATPTTLIALLRAVAYGWRQEKLAENAAEISALGKDLYKRLSDMGDHWVRAGKGLERAVEAYNSAVGTFENRVMVTARKFADLKTTPLGVEIAPLEPVEKSVRRIEEVAAESAPGWTD